MRLGHTSSKTKWLLWVIVISLALEIFYQGLRHTFIFFVECKIKPEDDQLIYVILSKIENACSSFCIYFSVHWRSTC